MLHSQVTLEKLNPWLLLFLVSRKGVEAMSQAMCEEKIREYILSTPV